MGCKWSSLYALGIETHIQFLSCVNPTLPLEISNSQCRRVNFLGSTAVSGVLVNWRVQECRPEPHGGGQGLLFGLVPLPLLFLLPGFGLFIAIPTKKPMQVVRVISGNNFIEIRSTTMGQSNKYVRTSYTAHTDVRTMQNYPPRA